MTRINILNHSLIAELALISYLGLIITNVHQLVPFLQSLHLEFICFIVFLGSFFSKSENLQKVLTPQKTAIKTPLLLGLLILTAPLASSLFGGGMLEVFNIDEYKSLIKIALFSPIAALIINNSKNKEQIISIITVFFGILACIFLYRYLILQEVREFDLRPQVKIKNGDANFMCAFFSMMIPIALRQSFIYGSKKNPLAIVFVIIAILLLGSSVATQSRMGLIATAVGLIYLGTRPIWGLKSKVLGTSILLILVFILAQFYGSDILNRYERIIDKSNVDRFLTFKNGWLVFMDNPFFGVGMDRVQDFFYRNTLFPDFQSEFRPLVVHNTPLQILSEMGIVGMICYFALFYWSAKRIFTNKLTDSIFIKTSFVILIISSMTVALPYKELVIFQFFLLASISISKESDVL